VSQLIKYCVQDVDSYIHRSGRTGRAGRSGISVVLYQASEMAGLGTVERVAVSSTDAKLHGCKSLLLTLMIFDVYCITAPYGPREL